MSIFSKIAKKIFYYTNDKKYINVIFLGIKINFKCYPECDKLINRKINEYKYVHIMYNDKFNKPFVDFLNKYFDIKEHMILCHKTHKDESPTIFPTGENVYEYVNLKKINLGVSNVKKIICHSFFPKGLVKKLYKEKNLLKKVYWVIWGGDLYSPLQNKENNYVRKHCKAYVSAIKGDEIKAAEKYNPKAKLYSAPYLLSTTENMLSVVKKKNDYVRIQINNSCDESTLEMLDILSKFKDENIKITTVLSYGDLKYKDAIIEKANDIFKDKFEYLDKYLNPEEYTNYIANNDIIIFNQNRQQGVGNAIMGIALGCKVYIKSQVTSFDYLSSKNYKIYDTHKIKDMDFEQFIKYELNIQQENMNNGKKYFQDENAPVEEWKRVFE